ncbi:NaCP60E [Symbiodinium sp. CCMP2592]|nr:NaCP60E [Symbiodinium sp. CCMP2592]
MSTVIESEAAFNQRCAEASKDATLHTKLVAQGIRCFKTLAFAIGSPQQPPTEAQFDEFSVKVYGAAPTMGQTAILRHLHFEATTLVVQTYRDMVTHDPSDPSHTRKVPVPEKRARLEFQRRRLSGMEISGELEPSHQLLDLANQQYESGVLTWIPASKCAKREAEVLALGKDRSSLLQVEQNVIKVGPGDQAIACDVSDPLRFQWAMMRRGIAFDNCHLLSWDVHQRWVQKMLDCLSATPPPSYSPVSLNQCMRADKELFLLLAREAAPPFKVDSLGVSPLDAKFSAMMYDVRLQQFLLPLPKQTAPVLAVPVDDGAERQKMEMFVGISILLQAGAFSSVVQSQGARDCTVGAAAAGEQTKPLVYRALEQVRGEGSCLDEVAGLHRDENNRDGPTLLVPLTDFENGELWFQKVGGDVASLNDPSLEGRGKVAELSCLLIRCVSARSSGLNYELPSQRDASSVRQSAAGMYFVELCAGTAVLSKAAAKLGFRPFAVDSSRKRAGEQAVIMDLSDPAQAEAVVDFLRVEYHHVICVFISPPVGTASFMRERRKPGSVELDLKMPNALRSALHPDGLPTLRGRDKLQVERANQLFDQLANIACEACDLGILTVLESPSNSRYWDTSFCAQVTNHVQGHFVKFHACVHGGHRPKLMQLWSSQDVFGMLAGRCDGSHEHKPWRPFISKRKRVSFITADEPEFPPLLVDRILGCIVHAHPSLSFGPRVLAQAIQDPSANVARINLGTQPRGNSLPSLVWEFDTTLDFVVPVQCDKPLEAVLSSLPKGSRIFSRRVCEWGSLKSLLEGVGKPKTNIVGLDPLHPPACAELVQVGVPCSEEVFVARAIAAGHPRSLAVHVEPFVTVSARANFEAPPAELASFRIDAMKFWIGRAGALKEKEQELHQNLPDHLRPILKGKKLLLLQEMMRAAGCEDVDLVSDICQGFKLSGWLPASGEFVPRSRRPKFSVETLGVLSKGLNKATLQKLSRRQDSEIEESTWVETQKEIDSGWVWLEEGPVPEMVSIAMRFGIMQNKLRVIDDLSCCGLNATVGLLEKFCLHTIDKLAAMMAHAFDVVSGVMPECCGRTFDLTAAYKQFGVCAADRERLRIAVNRPGHHKPSFLGVNALPFGGVGSVAAFLRISIALWKIGIVLFRLFWSAFFDDYSIVSAKSLESNAQWTVETLFDLLGFRFAKDGSKAEPFGVTFNMLGLSVDLSCVKQRILRVGHTQKRKEELTEYIQTILQEGKIDSKAAERLRGRMVFFEGFTFGRVSNRAQRVVAKCVEKFAPQNLTEDLMWALTWLRERIALSQPLVVERNLITTLIVFTDGACNPEEGTGGVGGVLVNASGTPCEFFGEAVPSDMMQQLLSISANPIFELELIPALISLVIWAERLKGAQVVFYLDNDGARHSLIRTFGGGSLANAVIESFLQLETTLQLKTWFARVPTACNIADNPSRLEFEPLLKRGAARRAIPWDQVMP